MDKGRVMVRRFMFGIYICLLSSRSVFVQLVTLQGLKRVSNVRKMCGVYA